MKADIYNIEDIWLGNLPIFNKLLFSLALRKNKNIKTWCQWFDYSNPKYAICYVCNATFDNSTMLRLHGYQHLKEHNLLPFI